MLTSLALGFLVGAVLGVTGAGGGILAVPVLVAGMHWTMQQAAPVALIAVSGSAAVGAIGALRQGMVRYRAAFVIALAGVPTTFLGMNVARSLPQRTLHLVFGAVMLLVATRLIRQALKRGAVSVNTSSWCVGHMNPSTGRLAWTKPMAAALGGIGAITGFMTGLLGVGGGFVIVPLLRQLTDVSMHGIAATSLMVITLVGAGSLILNVAHGISIPIEFALGFSVTTALGMSLGRLASHRLSERHVQISFACVLFCVSVALVFKAAFSE